ncbi:F0F1 ATP synthase subunit delta [Alkalicaulis satelles]|uniref:ATP synthase subunit delta n=1 Tax=Alkalicaulis satelles TaxID=2609175 RepID=A0A5M6ZEM2_9PROT|nr:F0F1 ATP synthase subunit delta [Alkalicaulis satelles]KAA5802324.1 F0F1 ATP synthase subunit delta [Alkalicaulis satelles]
MTTGQDAITSEAGGRYARALFELADEAGALDAVEADMTALGAAFAQSAELRRALSSPVHKTGDKAAVLAALAQKLKFQDMTARFLAVTAGNGRAGELPDMARAFAALAAKRRGALSADVASADALTAAQLKDLAAALKTALGKDVEIRAEVRPELIGGLIVKVGSRLFDSSLSTQLEGLRKSLKEA